MGGDSSYHRTNSSAQPLLLQEVGEVGRAGLGDAEIRHFSVFGRESVNLIRSRRVVGVVVCSHPREGWMKLRVTLVRVNANLLILTEQGVVIYGPQ